MDPGLGAVPGRAAIDGGHFQGVDAVAVVGEVRALLVVTLRARTSGGGSTGHGRKLDARRRVERATDQRRNDSGRLLAGQGEQCRRPPDAPQRCDSQPAKADRCAYRAGRESEPRHAAVPLAAPAA
jgi:hypothetical protein